MAFGLDRDSVDAAKHSEEEELDMSTHGSADLMDLGDTHAADQQNVIEVRDEPVITDPERSVASAGASHSEV